MPEQDVPMDIKPGSGGRLRYDKERRTIVAVAALDTATGLQAENVRLRAAMQEACDLLAERVYGSSARSPGHNARVLLESALANGNITTPPETK